MAGNVLSTRCKKSNSKFESVTTSTSCEVQRAASHKRTQRDFGHRAGRDRPCLSTMTSTRRRRPLLFSFLLMIATLARGFVMTTTRSNHLHRHSKNRTPASLFASKQDTSGLLRSFLWNFGPFGASTVLVWRGVWDLQDELFFPEHPVVSACGSAVLGTVLGGMLRVRKTSPSSANTLLLSVATISYWRGIWELWDQLVLPQDSTLQSVVGLGVGALVLFGTQSFRLGVPGVPVVDQSVDRDPSQQQDDTD